MKQERVFKNLLQYVTEVYYKVNQVLQRQVLQSVTGCYYKVRQNTCQTRQILAAFSRELFSKTGKRFSLFSGKVSF